MRNTTISNSIATVVCRVIVSVVVAAVVRTFLHLTPVREPMGYWQRRKQPSFALAGGLAFHRAGNTDPSQQLGRGCHSWHAGVPAFAAYAAPSMLTSEMATRRG